jgi:hypothetical protein
MRLDTFPDSHLIGQNEDSGEGKRYSEGKPNSIPG